MHPIATYMNNYDHLSSRLYRDIQLGSVRLTKVCRIQSVSGSCIVDEELKGNHAVNCKFGIPDNVDSCACFEVCICAIYLPCAHHALDRQVSFIGQLDLIPFYSWQLVI